MDLIKKFMKIGGFQTREDLEAYGEEKFFNDFPEARQYARGGTIEAYPQIATFDKAFSYGVKPGPQYLAHGGSAYPQAQTEQQFFIPIYTDVYNPYNKAMGGSNIEMYPNAKTPHWGPTNVWFQEGGQEGMQNDGQELDRAGALNRTGSFVNNLKTTAAKANAKNAMMGAIDSVGMAQYGKQLNKYQGATTGSQTGSTPTATTTTPSYMTKDDFTSSFGPAMDEYMKKREQQQQAMMVALLQQAYGYNPRTQGYMNDFLPSVYDWNNLDNFMYREKGSPGFRWKTNVPGQGKKRGVSNMPFIQAYFPELYGDPDAAQKVLNDPKYAERRKQLGLTRYTETPVGLFKRKTRRDYYFGEEPTKSTFKDWGTGTASAAATPAAAATATQNPKSSQTPVKGVPPMLQNNPAYSAPPQTAGLTIPGIISSASPQPSTSVAAPLLMPGQQSYDPTVAAAQSSTSGVPPMLQNNPAYTAPIQQSGVGIPGIGSSSSSQPSTNTTIPYAPGMSPAVTTTTSQAPSNANSMDPNVAKKKAAMMNPNVNQAYIDAMRGESTSGVPYKNLVGPLAEPSSGMDYKEPVNPYLSVMAGNAPVTMTAQPDPNAYLTGPPYKTPVGPVVGPDGYAYGGNTGYRYGGSYRQGDVVYMSDDEIAEFIRNGGQIEEME
jgi:hypothetical protein